MRIISSFKDYYDGGLMFGVDPNIVYVRETKSYRSWTHNSENPKSKEEEKVFEYALKNLFKDFELPPRNLKQVVGTVWKLIFCGKMYTINMGGYLSFDEAMEHSEGEWKPYQEMYKSYYRKEYVPDGKNKKHNIYDSHETLRKEFEVDKQGKSVSNDVMNILLDQKLPIVCLEYHSSYRTNRWNETTPHTCYIVNPCLKDVKFYKVLGIHETFQEIAMFMSNCGMPGKEMVALSDKDRIIKHGFDLKTSFRKVK